MSDNADELMNVFNDTETFVAMWTGVKAQFVAAGWSAQNAELMVIELFRMNSTLQT